MVFPTPAVASASLDIPDPAIEKFPHSSRRMRVHTVRRGETMRSIAAKYDMSADRLMKINGLRKPRIFPGQTLLLTRASSSKSSKGSKSKASSASRTSGTSKTSKKRSGASSKASARTK